MAEHKIYKMAFSSVYPHYIHKVERKNRTKEEVDILIKWLTGYTQEALEYIVQSDLSFEAFFAQAPQYHEHANQVKGVICGVRVETIADPLMQKIRVLDKIIDELAKGKALDKILR